jgi:hypothetical protein
MAVCEASFLMMPIAVFSVAVNFRLAKEEGRYPASSPMIQLSHASVKRVLIT